MRRIAVFIVALLCLPQLAAASPLRKDVRRAADLLLSREGTWGNGNTGIGTYDCSFEWEVGTGFAYANVQGISAMGLPEAYEALGKKAYLGDAGSGATCAAWQMIGRYNATADRAFAQDLQFLIEMSEVTRNPVYYYYAWTYFGRTMAAYPNGADLADHYLDDNQRMSLAGWDLSSHILVAWSLGQRQYAHDIAQRLIDRRADWEGVLYGGYDYTTLSRGYLIAALAGFRHDHAIRDYREEILAAVLAAQDTDGSWDDGDFQTTAYAMLGLETVDNNRHVRRALTGGKKYLLSMQSAEGGWSYPPEYNEIDSEVIMALAPLVKNQFQDDRDDFEGPRHHHRKWCRASEIR